MKILVTGANGFIGKNLTVELKSRTGLEILEYDQETAPALLDQYCREAEFVFHLAGVNRPQKEVEFTEGNVTFTARLIDKLKKYRSDSPVMMASSIQAALDNPYGKSKREGEELLLEYGRETGVKILIYRFPNVFGKWCRPHYNSAVATFCYNIARDLPITISDPTVVMNLVYIDDLVEELISAMNGNECVKGAYCQVPVVHSINLGEIADLLNTFKRSRNQRSIPNMGDPFVKKLYSTYLSYLPEDQFGYELKMNVDSRGSFTEFIRTPERGQISVNISKPGIVKGNHWHHTKNEKFLIVSGKGVIRFRKIGSDEIIEYYAGGGDMKVIDIPPGYTHHIVNLGEDDLITIMWANEPYDPEKPDTYYLEV